MNLWGDFYGVERRLRERLAATPEAVSLQLSLSRALFSQQRYEEARGGVRRLLRRADLGPRQRADVLLLAGQIAFMEKKYAEAVEQTRAALALRPADAEALLLQATVLMADGRYEEAAAAYRQLATPAGLIGLGRALLRLDREPEARQSFAQGMELAPRDPAALFFGLGLDGKDGRALEAALADTTHSAKALHAWAEIFASQGRYGAAAACENAALDRDPAHFPARLGLAEAQAAAKNYDQALQTLAPLRHDMPESSKIALTEARFLAWSKRYEASLDAYARLQRENPADPVLKKEAARTAWWGKMPEQGETLFRSIYAAPVDHQLALPRGKSDERQPGASSISPAP